MKTTVLDMTGHACCHQPIERHEFTGNGFNCDSCGRPRALHSADGFHPSSIPSRMPLDPACRYRGAHPRFTRPGAFNPDSVPEATEADRKRVARIRHDEKLALERALSRAKRS